MKEKKKKEHKKNRNEYINTNDIKEIEIIDEEIFTGVVNFYSEKKDMTSIKFTIDGVEVSRFVKGKYDGVVEFKIINDEIVINN